jgi:predicted AAA+ superfamily ATPase
MPRSPLDLLLEKLEDGFSRTAAGTVPRQVPEPWHFDGKATVVIGPRRAGKTTFLHQVRDAYRERGWSVDRLPLLHLEDERLAGLEAEDLSALVEAYYRRWPERRRAETVAWFLDEIQVVPGWERFVRRLMDEERVHVYLTGSSADLLSMEIATALRGRAWTLRLYPYGWREYLRAEGLEPPSTGWPTDAASRSRREAAWDRYLRGGGYPEAVGLDDAVRFRLLRDYVDVALLRDVVERHGVSNVEALRWMVRHLLRHPAGPFSASKFHQALRSQGIAVGKDTVHDLLHHLTDAFLVRTVWMESSSERQRMIHPRKAYPIDPGLIPVFDRSGKRNLGQTLETVVLLELERRYAETTYVLTPDGHEVDFLARYPDGRQVLLQVCADASDPDTLARELRSLAGAREAHPAAERLLLTDTAAAPAGLPAGVTWRRVDAWLFSE